jgi:hypothetical protein
MLMILEKKLHVAKILALYTLQCGWQYLYLCQCKSIMSIGFQKYVCYSFIFLIQHFCTRLYYPGMALWLLYYLHSCIIFITSILHSPFISYHSYSPNAPRYIHDINLYTSSWCFIIE